MCSTCLVANNGWTCENRSVVGTLSAFRHFIIQNAESVPDAKTIRNYRMKHSSNGHIYVRNRAKLVEWLGGVLPSLKAMGTCYRHFWHHVLKKSEKIWIHEKYGFSWTVNQTPRQSLDFQQHIFPDDNFSLIINVGGRISTTI